MHAHTVPVVESMEAAGDALELNVGLWSEPVGK
jgi:hypothetical protein